LQGLSQSVSGVDCPCFRGEGRFEVLELTIAFLVSAALGVHAYYYHARERDEIVSARRWLFGLYSAAFLVVALANCAQLVVTIMAGDHRRLFVHLVTITLVMVVSYSFVLIGVRRKSY